jgi:hypothetical protein
LVPFLKEIVSYKRTKTQGLCDFVS